MHALEATIIIYIGFFSQPTFSAVSKPTFSKLWHTMCLYRQYKQCCPNLFNKVYLLGNKHIFFRNFPNSASKFYDVIP